MLVGVPYDLFWGDMTPKLLQKFTKAYNRRLQDADKLNYSLGQYVGIAVNNSKKYPKKPFLSEDKIVEFSDKEFHKLAKQRYSKKE